ncbi:MAG: hypothetical protein WD535_06510 [Thermaerobacterales bacterium]
MNTPRHLPGRSEKAAGAMRLIARFAYLFAGLFILAYGINLTRAAQLGLAPWSVLHEGLALRTPITFGTATILVGLVVIGLAAALGIRPRLGTLLNMTVIGLFTDMIFVWGLLPAPGALNIALPVPLVWIQAGYLLAGTMVMGLGIGWYVTANFGAGPRDAFMLGMVRKTGWQVGTIRTLMEGTVLAGGWLIGGPVGAGTVIGMVTVGWTIQASLALFRRLATVKFLSAVIQIPAEQRPYSSTPSTAASAQIPSPSRRTG